MSALTIVAAQVAALPTAEGDPLGPADVFATFGTGALAVVPWIAAGLAAAIPLYFAVIGIRKGLAWFMSIVRKA
jgi:hypothetical protein